MFLLITSLIVIAKGTSLKTYLNGFQILEYLHEMCFTCFQRRLELYILQKNKSFVTYFQELDAVFVNSHITWPTPQNWLMTHKHGFGSVRQT